MKTKIYTLIPTITASLGYFTVFTIILCCSITNNAFAQANKTTKVSTSAISSVGNEATVGNVNYMWTVGEAIVFTGIDVTGFLTQGFNQPMICKAFPTIVALNQTSCSLPYSLAVAAGYDKYVWKYGKATIANALGDTYNPVVNGNHTVTVMDSTGCTLTSAAITVDLSGKNIIPTITPIGTAAKDSLLECSDAFTYQWYVVTPSDGVHRAIMSQTNKYYAPLYNGTYYVKINTQEYCVAYSVYYTVNNAGFSPINKGDFESTDTTIALFGNHKVLAYNLKVYPIPAKDKVNIEYESSENNTVVFNFYDVKGILIDTKLMKSGNGKMNLVYDNANLPTGKYMLRVIDGDRKFDKGLMFE